MKAPLEEKDITDPQIAYYYRNPSKYAETARTIDLCMEFMHRPCMRGDSCDLDYLCARHERATEVVSRYLRMKQAKKEREAANEK